MIARSKLHEIHSPRNVQIVFPRDAGQIERIRTLFREYADAAGACECFAGFDQEIAGLPGQYGPPDGQLLVAEVDGHSAGCVALRSLDDGISEMKRLYVRPAFRRRRLGRLLTEAIIAEARRLDYPALRLDTLPSMAAARALYLSLVIRLIPRYNDNPEPGVTHLYPK